MRINLLPNMPEPQQSTDLVAVNRSGIDYKVPMGALANAHYDVTIAANAWTYSGQQYTYDYTASDVSVDKQLAIETDDTIKNATSTINIAPGSGKITFTTSLKPNGSIKFSITALGAAGDNVGGLSGDVASLIAAIATEYDTSGTYTAPDYCWHSGVLYRCTSQTSVTGTWDATKWTAAVVTDELAAAIANLYSITVSNGALVIQGVTL